MEMIKLVVMMQCGNVAPRFEPIVHQSIAQRQSIVAGF